MTRLTRLLPLAALAALLLLPASPASAQAACASHDAIAAHLGDRFEERVTGRGLANDGRVLFELFTSESGSWTIVVTRPRGHSCIVAAGESWQRLPPLVGETASAPTF